jgi:predicted HAD superfamily Cof-like phosphohydrolase
MIDKSNSSLTNKDWMYQSVSDFHSAFGHPVSQFPAILSDNRVFKRANWMSEEIDELRQSKNLEDQIDAVIDLIYFAIGTLVEIGVEPSEAFEIVHQSNMSKLGPNGKVLFHSDGKIKKPDSWVSPTQALNTMLRRKTMIGTFENDKEVKTNWRAFEVLPGLCLAGCLAVTLNQLFPKSNVSADIIDQWLPMPTRHESNMPLNKEREVGKGFREVEFAEKCLELGMPISVEYRQANTFEEWELEDILKDAAKKQAKVICTLSAGKLFGTSRLSLGHAVVLLALEGQRVSFFDVEANNFGFHKTSLEQLYNASRFRTGGLIILTKTTDLAPAS